jgi:hypothetical protein
MEHDDIIHMLQIIRDQIRYGKTFDADIKLDSLQRMLAEEKLTSDNSDYAKLPKYIDIANISGVRPSDIKKVCDAIKQLGNFA